MLAKEDLWLVLDNYPQSLLKIIEKGKSILRKDNLLDESITDIKRHVEQEQLLSVPNRVRKLIDLDESLNHRMKNFLATYISSIGLFKQQLSLVEYYYGVRKPSASLSCKIPIPSPSYPHLMKYPSASL